jgi:acetolactate synthase I/II/III large subunit
MRSTLAPPTPARAPVRMTGADAIVRALEREAVTVCFGMPGGAILPLYDALARGTTVRHVLARHEQGAGHMAQGYARASGRPGVVFATSGPGATNLVTPIADARMDSTPLVCITGQVRQTLIGTDAFQECDIVGVTAPLVKRAWQVLDASQLAATVHEAFRVAGSGRPGPVLVDVPRDVQEQLCDDDSGEGRGDASEPARAVDAGALERALQLLAESGSPVVYAGGGVVNAGAAAELRVLAERLGAPVVTTLMGKGAFPESHALFAGHPGMHGHKHANWALNRADLIVAVGVRFDDRVTGRLDAFAPAARVIHLDIDPREIGKLRHADAGLAGDLRAGLRALATAPAARDDARRAWRATVDEWKVRFPLRVPAVRATGEPSPQALVRELQRLLASRDVIYTTGVGQHQMFAMQHLKLEAPRRFITSGGLATMGFGLPAAIGASTARPGTTVVCIDGDGSFQMTSQELATAVQERLPVIVVVVDNGSLGMVEQWQRMFYAGRLSHVELAPAAPDYAALARAYGAFGASVSTLAELRPALMTALASGGPALLHVRVDATVACYPMIPPGAAAVDCIEGPEEGRDRGV